MIDKEDEFKEYLRTTGVNGGFKVFVKGFPNGRLHPFIQRGGFEHKSRSFVMLNFQGDYRPDYGRKKPEIRLSRFSQCTLQVFDVIHRRAQSLWTGFTCYAWLTRMICRMWRRAEPAVWLRK